MSHVQEARCPNCGAPVPPNAFAQRAVACTYCGTTLALPGSTQQPAGAVQPSGEAPPYGVPLDGWAVVLEHPGKNLINTIREIREISGFSLLDAKNAAEKPPSLVPVVTPGMTRADIERRLNGCRFGFRRLR